jgi:hypothetical protein
MNAVGLVIVEGPTDVLILDCIVPNGFMVMPCGGKFQMKTYLEVYSNRTDLAVHFDPRLAVGFRDRDFDFPMPEQQTLSTAGGKPLQDAGQCPVFVSHRRTIENYLIAPADYSSYYNAKRLQAAWLPSESEYADRLRQAAEDIRHYQAVLAALGEVRRPNTLGTTLLGSSGEPLRSGVLPTQLGEAYCLQAAHDILHAYRQSASNIGDDSAFEAAYKRHLALFDEEFMAHGKYMEWFQGKDLKAAMRLRWPNNRPGFPWSDFEKHAILNFDHTQFPDLVEFRLILQQRLSQN